MSDKHPRTSASPDTRAIWLAGYIEGTTLYLTESGVEVLTLDTQVTLLAAAKGLVAKLTAG